MSECCITGGALDFIFRSVSRLVQFFLLLTSSCYEKGRVWTLFLPDCLYTLFCAVESITLCVCLALALMLR